MVISHLQTWEKFFVIAKQEVYDKNWKAKSKDQLTRRIKQNIPNMDTAPIIKMFENLKPKIFKAAEFGLRSLH